LIFKLLKGKQLPISEEELTTLQKLLKQRIDTNIKRGINNYENTSQTER